MGVNHYLLVERETLLLQHQYMLERECESLLVEYAEAPLTLPSTERSVVYHGAPYM